jgi:diguanylate cyclase (GGDEF)-like protein/PAS domain S-box-containing protein
LIGLIGLGISYRRECDLENKREQSEAARRESEELFSNYFSLGQVGMCITSLDQKWLNVNPRLCEMLGYTQQELVRLTWTELTHPEDLEVDLAQFRRLMSGEIERYSMDKRFIHKAGNIVYTYLTVSCKRKPDGTVDYVIASLEDITERKKSEQVVQHMAHYDGLTGLPNRALFTDRLQQALAKAHREKARMALLFIDLDKFKPVNDELGHHVGDLLLEEAAKRMQTCVRESDTVGRIGGDEFLVLLPVIEVAQDALLVAEKIREALIQPFSLVGLCLNISASVGIAVYPDHGENEKQLMKNADAAMYLAKEAGRNSVNLYQSDK